MKMKRLLIITICLVATANLFAQEQKKPNVLFIAIDDLKPILGCYGDKMIKTPNIDRLAKMGTVFMSNYVQQAVCGPTRASLMTGKRPDYTKVWDLKTPMRDVNPDILSLPQYLITQGYSTQGIGKVYDSRDVDKDLDKPSWSVPYYKNAEEYYDKTAGLPVNVEYQSAECKKQAAKFTLEAEAKGIKGKDLKQYINERVRPTTECLDLPDNAYEDGANALKAKDVLINLSKTPDQPFFFAVGFHKPHLPFVSPKRYWDLYNREDMPVAKFQEKSKNGVDIAYHNAGEMRLYTDIPELISFTDQKPWGLTLPLAKQKELIHGYYAAVSYTDAQVGILLNTLDSLGLTNNTIIVLWGDHGWHLGDHNLWCKHTNFEQATHAPLIIAAPGFKHGETKSMTEHVDIFPTVCDLVGVKIPEIVDGKSLVPLMKDNKTEVKEYSVSQYPRSGAGAETERLGYASAEFMGYSIRDHRYRYTVWLGKGFRSTQPYSKDLVVGTELYDYKVDPLETVNVYKEPKYADIAKKMEAEMVAYFKAHETK